jgi:hypothetical protein
MTIFGKIVMGTLLFAVVGGVFYGVTSYVNKDTAGTPLQVVATTTPEVEVVVATTTATTTASTTPEKPAGKKIAFTEFMKKTGSYKCTVTQTVATMTTNGTVYLDEGKVKADFAVSVAGQSINTSMIVRDGYSYTWTSNSPTKGFKTKIAGSATGSGSSSPKGTYTWDGSQIGDYSCDPWVAEASMFEIPKTVTFTVQ